MPGVARSEAALMVWGRLAQVMRWHGRCAALAGRQRRAVARRTLATRRLGQVVLCGSSELACGWRSDATLRAGGDLRRRCCAEVVGAVRVRLGTAVRGDGRRATRRFVARQACSARGRRGEQRSGCGSEASARAGRSRSGARACGTGEEEGVRPAGAGPPQFKGIQLNTHYF